MTTPHRSACRQAGAALATRAALTGVLAAALPAAAGAQLTTAQFQQAYEAQMRRLLTPGFTARTVLFQQVQPAGANAFRVSALVHDYGPGYPPNRYYGQTCVGRVTGEVFTATPDGAGGWRVGGRMTPPDRECKDNPAAGVSAIPVASLGGTRAAAGALPVAPAVRPMPDGSYECWAFSQAQLGLNFTVTGPGRYRASDGSTGTFRVDPATGRVAFAGYLQGAMPDGYTATYANRRGVPTVSFMSPRGSEAAFCEKAAR